MDPVIRVVITNDRGVSMPLPLSASGSSVSIAGGSDISSTSSSTAATITLPFQRRRPTGRVYRSEENVGEGLTADESPDDNDFLGREQEGRQGAQGAAAAFERIEADEDVFQDEGAETHGPLVHVRKRSPVTTSTGAGCEAISARNSTDRSSSRGGRNEKRAFRRSASTRIVSTGSAVVAAGASRLSRLPSLFYRRKQQLQSTTTKPAAPSSGSFSVDRAKLFLDVFASPTASSSSSSTYSDRRRRLRQQSLHYSTPYYRGRVVSERDYDDEDDDDDDDRTVCTNTPVTPIRARLPSLFGILNSNSNTSGLVSPRRQGRGWRRMSADETMAETHQQNRGPAEQAVDPTSVGMRFLRRPHSFNTKFGQRLRSQSLQTGSGGETTSDDEAAAAVALLGDDWRSRREVGDDAAATVSLLPSGSGAGQYRYLNHHPHYGAASSNHTAVSLMNVAEEAEPGAASSGSSGVQVALAIPSPAVGGVRVIAKRRSSAYLGHAPTPCNLRKHPGQHSHFRHHHDHHSHQLVATGAGWSSTSPTPPPPLGAPCTKRCCVTRMSGGSYYGSTELLNLDDSRRRTYWESAETPPRDCSVWTFGG